jgi:hypothetical protein
MLEDETCWLLAADFDKATWRDDAAAFVRACAALRIPAALERSRSGGQGGHAWIFFAEPVPASLARRLGRISSPRRWSEIRISASHPTTASFRVRTICRQVVSEIVGNRGYESQLVASPIFANLTLFCAYCRPLGALGRTLVLLTSQLRLCGMNWRIVGSSPRLSL